MAASHFDVATNWVDVNTNKPKARWRKGAKVFHEGRRIFSYGHHFELGRALKDRKGHTTAFLLNGDSYSVSTTRHQSEVRAAAQRSGLPVVIIPYSALSAAGIDMNTVRILEATPDGSETIEHRSKEFQDHWRWRVDEERGYVRKSDERLQALVAARNQGAVSVYERAKERYAHYVERGDDVMASVYRDDAESGGPTLITVDDLDRYEVEEWVVVRRVRRLYTSGVSGTSITVHRDGDGNPTHYTWQTYRHWLGESLIEAEVPVSRTIRCKRCKGRGSLPPAVVPMTGLVTVPDSPDSDELPYPGSRSRARHLSNCHECSGNGGRSRFSKRRAKFLSGFDHQEPRRSYFFCELPRSNARTVDEAYEVLKPDPVRLAEQMERPIVRQGDIFAVELRSLDKRALRKRGAVFTPRGNLLGTNHRATETATLPDGTLLARGVLQHVPMFRRPDHVRQRLGKNWHVIVKNTVPLAA